MREWSAAREYFDRALGIDGKDYLSLLYLERCDKFIAGPPPAEWDGAVTLTEK
jgi:adenylate cyclase